MATFSAIQMQIVLTFTMVVKVCSQMYAMSSSNGGYPVAAPNAGYQMGYAMPPSGAYAAAVPQQPVFIILEKEVRTVETTTKKRKTTTITTTTEPPKSYDQNVQIVGIPEPVQVNVPHYVPYPVPVPHPYAMPNMLMQHWG